MIRRVKKIGRNESSYERESKSPCTCVLCAFINVCMYVGYTNKANIDLCSPSMKDKSSG